MRHVLLPILLMCSAGLSAQAPWAVKTNLTDLVVGRYSIGTEHSLNDTWSVGLDVDFLTRETFMESSHPWFPSQDARKRGIILQPQMRWHPGGNGLIGTYVSVDGFFGYARYRMANDEQHSIYQESLVLFPPPTGLRLSGGLRLGMALGGS